MRNATIAALVVLLAGLAGLLAVGLSQGSALVYTLGVLPQGRIANLAPGDRACQGPIQPPDGASFERIGFYPRSPDRAEAPLRVTVRRASGGATLAGGTLEPGYGAASPPRLRRVAIGRLEPRQAIVVCFDNRGDSPVELWGTAGIASPPTTASINGKPVDFDLGVTLEHARKRSFIALAPEIAQRASLFHASWVSPAAWGVVALFVLVGVPTLLLLALRRAAAADR